jgi:hypothetical protein
MIVIFISLLLTVGPVRGLAAPDGDTGLECLRTEPRMNTNTVERSKETVERL